MRRGSTKPLHHATLPQSHHDLEQTRRHRLASERHTRGINQQARLDAFLFRQSAQASLRCREVEGLGMGKSRTEFLEQLR